MLEGGSCYKRQLPLFTYNEKVGTSKEKLYLGGGYYHSPAVYVKENGVWRLHYICRDYLGSITHITDHSGKLLAEYSYDAWGRMRNPVSQNVYAPGGNPELWLLERKHRVSEPRFPGGCGCDIRISVWWERLFIVLFSKRK